jgi:hypothetical protein
MVNGVCFKNKVQMRYKIITLQRNDKTFFCTRIFANLSRVQMKSWAGKALETVNCCAFLKRRLIGAC